jgi:hypothetical protein
MVDWEGGRRAGPSKTAEVPQLGLWGTGTGDDGMAAVSDGDGLGIKRGDTTHVAELDNGNEGARCKVWEIVGVTCLNGKIGEMEPSHMAGVNDAAIRKSDGDTVGGQLDVDKRGINGEEMAGVAGFGDVGGESGSWGGTWAYSRAI